MKCLFMRTTMGFSSLLSLLCFSWSFFILGTHQLQSSQRQVLLQLRKHLEYPWQLESWNNHTVDLCYFPPSAQVSITCQNDFVSELEILGDKPVKVRKFDGFAIPPQTLSGNFSLDSLVATLARLTSLRVLRLVSLGIWGPLPDKINRLSSLEYLDLSSNFLYGSIPPKVLTLVRLQNLTLDGNFLNGSVPDGLDALSNLTFLSLRSNRLSGPLPSGLQKLTALTYLAASNNEISGKLPDLSGLNGLYMVDLSRNKIDSGPPSFPRGLIMAFLSHNSFSGVIPKQYDQLLQLQQLDLSFNFFVGMPPATIFSLPNISYLNFASNMLRGSLPKHLHCGGNLGSVDISNNMLTGELPPCLSTALNKRNVKFGGNCLASHLQHQHAKSYCVEHSLVKKKQQKGQNLGILVGVLGGIFGIATLLGFGLFVFCRRYCPRGTSEQHLLQKAVHENSATGFSVELLTNARYMSQASKIGSEGFPVCRSFSMEELKEATLNFDKSTCISEGSNGKLYKGRLENGTQVAIRCLLLSKKYTTRNLKLRLDLLGRLRHPHLVCLLGHCIDVSRQDLTSGNRILLVYEYMSNGNLHTHLSKTNLEKVLKWSDRLAILIGIAKAVHFLHTGVIPGFSNNRLKTNNILLNMHQMAKLSDYGLSIIREETDRHEVKAEGAKTWQAKNLDDDVYDFGLILLESLVGPSISSRSEELLLHEMKSLNSKEGQRRILDPIVLETSSEDSLTIVISLTNKCISPDSCRPTFEDVLWNLQYAAQVQAN